METLANKIVTYNKGLNFTKQLPNGFKVLNPYLDNPETLQVMQMFYEKYYDDSRGRKFIIGINPSRNGAGVTGIPFTDTKRLQSVCGITMKSAQTHEVSSVFIYEMIKEFGGADRFYNEFYINSPFPLAIVRQSPKGDWLNANYYDDKSLFDCVKSYMIESLHQQISMGLDTSKVFVLGKKNATYIQKINKEIQLFEKIEVLEHPRYIEQYKSKEKMLYIDKYITTLTS